MHEFFFNLEGGTALAANWYVVSDGDAAPTTVKYSSTSWTAADTGTTATDLNTFLNSSTVASGDTVYIKAGEYKLSAQIDLTSKVLHLYGGFAGTETTSSDRDLDTNRTTLNANADATNKRSVLYIRTNSTIDGFTIKGGSNDYGGGIYISGNPTITNCTIAGNTAAGSDDRGNGGGIHINSGKPTITNCAIVGNTLRGSGGGGGGISIRNGGTATIATITNCTITGNTANGYYGGGGICIRDRGTTATIINCTITGNTADGNNGGGGGICIKDSGTATIINCTIVNNTINSVGHEIYFDNNTITLYNTLIWNAETEKAIKLPDNSTITHYCAYPGATGDNNIVFDTWENPVSSDVTVKGVTHNVYKISDNSSALQGIIGNGSHDVAPSFDQVGNAFANPPIIGAVEYVLPVLSVDISGDIEISATYGTAKTSTFATTVSLSPDNKALTTGYTVSWDVTVSTDVSGISIDQSGDLTVGSATPIGTYEATVKAQATYGAAKSNVAEKTVTITVESGDITLTLTSKDLPGGKVGTVYSEDQYFTATVEPSSADISWDVSGLPEGLSFDKGKISGTPTASGDFSVKVTVTATLANYNTVSKDITASITIAAADGGSGDSDGGSGGSGGSTDDGKTITVPSSGISGLTDTQKKTVETLILNSVNDLSQITATDFPNLTSVKISSDVEVGNGGALDLSSLPASITTFSISGNSTVKSLNLKASKVANIDASGCFELKSVDVSGNTFIVTLDVSSTDIELLDASNCTNLTSVDCSYCLLSELNVAACNALYFVDCSHNSLLALDIPSGLTNLTSINCISQELGNWRSTVSFNFEEFVQSPDTVSASSVVKVSATKLTNVKNLKAYNNNKEIAIITSDDNGNITFASEPDKLTYDYDIGDINNTLMDVTVYSTGSSSQTNTLGSSGGGCNVIKNEGLSVRNVLILFLFAFALLNLKITRR